MQLTHTIDVIGNWQCQSIELRATAFSRGEAADLSYDDFEANLFIDELFIAEISELLSKADVFAQMIDDVDWEEMYCEMVAEAA